MWHSLSLGLNLTLPPRNLRAVVRRRILVGFTVRTGAVADQESYEVEETDEERIFTSSEDLVYEALMQYRY